MHELNIMEMEFLSALQYRTCVHHLQFFSWTSQCQHWMTQLNNNRPLLQPQQQQTKKRTADHFCSSSSAMKKRAFHPYGQAQQLSWSSSNYYHQYHPHHPAAAAVATVAAATAMNVNYSEFIPRV